jgi:transcriptional regulator with XRE-family HTH domain
VNKTRNSQYIIAFGKHVRTIRKSKNLSMEKLALAAGIEYSQIFDIEHGKINPTISTIHLIAKALDVHEKELFDFNFANSHP